MSPVDNSQFERQENFNSRVTMMDRTVVGQEINNIGITTVLVAGLLRDRRLVIVE